MYRYVCIGLVFSLYACERNVNTPPESQAGTTPQNQDESQRGRISPSMPGSRESFSSKPEDRPSAPER